MGSLSTRPQKTSYASAYRVSFWRWCGQRLWPGSPHLITKDKDLGDFRGSTVVRGVVGCCNVSRGSRFVQNRSTAAGVAPWRRGNLPFMGDLLYRRDRAEPHAAPLNITQIVLARPPPRGASPLNNDLGRRTPAAAVFGLVIRSRHLPSDPAVSIVVTRACSCLLVGRS